MKILISSGLYFQSAFDTGALWQFEREMEQTTALI